MAPVIITAEAGNRAELMRFGLVPYFTRGELPTFATINARVENLQSTPSWRGPWLRGQRCVVPASGFYEWQVQADGKSREPYFIRLADREVFAFAGLWDRSIRADGSSIYSFAIITIPAVGRLAEIHNAKQREPAILAAEHHATWLAGAAPVALATLRPYPDELLLDWRVARRVNAADNNDAALLDQLP